MFPGVVIVTPRSAVTPYCTSYPNSSSGVVIVTWGVAVTPGVVIITWRVAVTAGVL